MNPDHKSLETVLSMANCRQWGDKRQLKTLFRTILDLCSSIVLTFLIDAYLRDLLNILKKQSKQFQTRALSDDKQADVIDGFNTSSRYLDDILNINNV